MSKKQRIDGRSAAQLRPVNIIPNFVRNANGSCLIELGGTRVICTASIDNSVPTWREGSGKGWITAEYGMLPASTGQRKRRPGLKPDSRGIEIQRLIGRTLRNIIDLSKLGEYTIVLDCDVLEADGGTRTASITGAWVALALAVQKAISAKQFPKSVLTGQIAAVSVGIVNQTPMLDLCYQEDSRAEVDMNVAMTSKGTFVELQGTSEGRPFDMEQLQAMLQLAKRGIRLLLKHQRAVLKGDDS